MSEFNNSKGYQSLKNVILFLRKEILIFNFITIRGINRVDFIFSSLYLDAR